MNVSYAVAFAILGSGLLLAGILWSIPRLKRRASVRRFKHDLDHIDLVALGWAQSLRDPMAPPADDVPAPMPEERRARRARRNHGRAEGEPLV